MWENIIKREWTETYNDGAIILLCIGSAMVFIMIPGLSYLYAGLSKRDSALHITIACIMSAFVGMFQWYFWGYSLSFSATATHNKFIGNLHNFGFQNVLGGEDYPEMAFAIFQMMFMCVTLAILAGAIYARGRLIPMLVFCFIWSTIVYAPVCFAIWSPNGWAYQWGVLDYAGGGPVEILSGFSGITYSYFLGKRKQSLLINFRPHNVSYVTLGTILLYFGWLGFNGFTCIYPSLRVAYAIMNSHLSAAFGALTWCILDWRVEKKWSAVGLCSGCISGLVAATPSSGMITLYGSVIQGIVAGIVCNYSTKLKFLVDIDDSLDILAEHGMAGVVGLMFNAFFGDSTIISYDGVSDGIAGGFISHDYESIYKQICWILFTAGYSTFMTAVICIIMNKIPFLKLRASEDGEERGMDEYEVGEFAFDFIEVRRDFLSFGGTGVQTPAIENREVMHGTVEESSCLNSETNEKEQEKLYRLDNTNDDDGNAAQNQQHTIVAQ